MHPEICQFPSTYFYDGKLLNGDIIDERSASFHQTKGLGPYIFYDIVDGMEMHGENSGALSLCNEREVDAAIELLRFFKRRCVLSIKIHLSGISLYDIIDHFCRNLSALC